MILDLAVWYLMSAGFGQPTGGILMGAWETRDECEMARPADIVTDRARVEYACVPGEIVERWGRAQP